MTLLEFTSSLDGDVPPPSLDAPLLALWWDAKGRWDLAHEAAASGEGRDAAWVHAYLHRKEGDPGNARYWYDRARQPVATVPLADEWQAVAARLTERPTS